jgi:hypothetical protein
LNEGGDNILRKLNIVFVLSILILLFTGAVFASDNCSASIDNSNSDALDRELVSTEDTSSNTYDNSNTDEKNNDNSDEISIDNPKTTSFTNNDESKNLINNSESKSSSKIKIDTDNEENIAAGGDTVSKKSSRAVSKKFTKSQIQSAAKRLKLYVESQKRLPSFVTVGKTKVTMSELLYLLSKFVINSNSKINGKISFIKLQDPTKIITSNLKGKWYKTNGVKVAKNIISFINSNKRSPNFVKTSLGTMQFQSTVYYMARSVTFYKSNKRLPKYVTVNDAVFTTSSPRFASLKDIEKSAIDLKTYVERNHKLPSNIIVNNKKLRISEFLYLLCKANVDMGSTVNSMKVVDLPEQTQVTNNNLRGIWYKDNLISVATNLINFMDSNKRAPYTMSTSLGTMQFRSLVYYMARSITFYESNNRLPNYITVDDSIFTTNTNINTNNINANSQYVAYLKATRNCQVNSETIKNLANTITFGLTDNYAKANAIFNWVRDECGYSYYFNTKKGALTTLSSKTGNCCDLSHLVVAISRAAGIPARYAHGTCKFRSGNIIGHVWSELMVNGQWLKADASSNYNKFNEITNWNSVTMKGYYSELPF